jgi:hypothetical protein
VRPDKAAVFSRAKVPMFKKNSLNARIYRRMQKSKSVGEYHDWVINLSPADITFQTFKTIAKSQIKANERVKVIAEWVDDLVENLSLYNVAFFSYLLVASHEWAHFLGRDEKQAQEFQKQMDALLCEVVQAQMEKLKQMEKENEKNE